MSLSILLICDCLAYRKIFSINCFLTRKEKNLIVHKDNRQKLFYKHTCKIVSQKLQVLFSVSRSATNTTIQQKGKSKLSLGWPTTAVNHHQWGRSWGAGNPLQPGKVWKIPHNTMHRGVASTGPSTNSIYSSWTSTCHLD